MVDDRSLRTQFSLKALDTASAFNDVLGTLSIAPLAYRPEMDAPQGPSTGGGMQAVQHLKLVPRNPGGGPLLVGQINQKEMTAELRTWEHVDAIHRARFKRGVELERAGYADFLKRAEQFLQTLQFQTQLLGRPANLTPVGTEAVKRQQRNNGMAAAFLLGVVVAVLIFAAFWFLKRK